MNLLKKKILVTVAIAAILFILPSFADDIKSQNNQGDTIQYLFKDVSFFLVGQSGSINKIGMAKEESQSIGGENKKYIRMAWTDVNVSFYGWDSSKGWWFGFSWNEDILGQLKNMHTRIYTPQESLGMPANFEMRDSAGRVFNCSTVLSKTGWNTEVFPVPSDVQIKFPVKVLRFYVGDTRKGQGYILIDDIFAEVIGQTRDLIECIQSPGEKDFAGPELQNRKIRLINHSKKITGPLSVEIKVKDVLTDKTIFELNKKIKSMNPGQEQEITFSPEIKYGQFVNIEWATKDMRGSLKQASGSIKCTKMFHNNYESGKPARENYLKQWGREGGVYWGLPVDIAKKTGSQWIRTVDNYWPVIEVQKGQFDFLTLFEAIKTFEKYQTDIVFASMRYTSPFYTMEDLGFAPAYGVYNQALAKAVDGKITYYELGNETNGADKYLDTEISRSAAAGIHSSDANARVGNAGTAGLDIGFLKMQASRGLFEYLDDIVTHPYCAGAPESFGLLDQCYEANKIIDELGGMKFHYTTEWGYHHTNEKQENRAKWIPRHFVIEAAADVLKTGLFAWDNHFGIYDNSRPLPPAVSVNAYCSLVKDSQFAGWLQRDDKVWAAVFECAGKPLVMAWSPSENEQKFEVTGITKVSVLRDLYGNVLPMTQNGNKAVISIDGDPVYIEGLSKDVALTALQNSAKDANIRYRSLIEKSTLNDAPLWKELTQTDCPGTQAIREAIMSFQPQSSEIAYPEQAVIAQALRCSALAARIEAISAKDEITSKGINGTEAREKWQKCLAESVGQDVDIPSLRWVLNVWEKNDDEAKMHREAGNGKFALHLESLDEIFNKTCEVLTSKGHCVFFPIWPYLHSSNGEKLSEHIVFTPDKETAVQMRLHSYASKAYKAKVNLELPNDWKCEPMYWEDYVEPNHPINTKFAVTAGVTRTEKIYAVLSVEGKPEVKIPYDNFEIELPIDVDMEVLDSLLPSGPMKLVVSNKKISPVSGILRILPGIDLAPLAVADLNDIATGESCHVELMLPAGTSAPAYNEWKLFANFVMDDKMITKELTIDFGCATKVVKKPLIDGELEEWATAPVLHMDKASYTDGSFGSGWSKEDLSANIYTMWDSNNFYIAAKVNDQTFQQELYGLDIYRHDSVQLAFSEDGKRNINILLALTPKGPLVWRYDATHPSDNDPGTKSESAQLAVKLFPGKAVYECAIPWSEIFTSVPKDDQEMRFDILLNDDDVVAPRRYMYRYGGGIVHMSGPSNFGYMKLLSETESKLVKSDTPLHTSKVVFEENFEEYPEGKVPYLWQSVIHMGPAPESIVKAGVGRNNSKALVLNNVVGPKPAVYRNLIRQPKGLVPGEKYELRVWVKNGVTGIGVASDRAGVQGFQYLPEWKPSDQWQLVKTEIVYSDGLYLVIRNESFLDNLLIDDLEIVKVEP